MVGCKELCVGASKYVSFMFSALSFGLLKVLKMCFTASSHKYDNYAIDLNAKFMVARNPGEIIL